MQVTNTDKPTVTKVKTHTSANDEIKHRCAQEKARETDKDRKRKVKHDNMRVNFQHETGDQPIKILAP